MTAYVLRRIDRAATLAQRILDEDPDDTYALDVLAKVHARRKDWVRSHDLFSRVYHQDANHLNILHQMFRTGVYSARWPSLRTFLAVHPEILDHPYYVEILHRKISRLDPEKAWGEVAKLAKVAKMPETILQLWVDIDKEILQEDVADISAAVQRQAFNSGIHGRHSISHLIRIRGGEADLSKLCNEFGYASLFEWAALSNTWSETVVSDTMRSGLRTMENDKALELIENMSRFVPIHEILGSTLMPNDFASKNHSHLLDMVDNDLPHRLATMLRRGEVANAMELIESIGHLWKDQNRTELWTVVADVLVQNGHHLPARRILERLLLRNPTDAKIAFLHLRTYDMLRLHNDSLVPGEIALHIPGISVSAIEAHADNLAIIGKIELSENILRPYRETLNRRGHRLRMHFRFYDAQDPIAVTSLYSLMPPKVQKVSEFASHQALALNMLDRPEDALDTLSDLVENGEANACMTAYEIQRGRGRKREALAMINKSLNAYGYAPMSKSWANSDFLLSELQTEHVERYQSGPMVSVIMTAHKMNPMMDTAVRSILEQSHGNLELIIVDDASPNEDEAMYKLYTKDPRVRIIRQTANSGTYAGRNAGLAAATGEYITFIDSDDWQHPQKIEKCIERMEAEEFLVATLDSYVRLSPTGELAQVGSWFVRKALMAIFWRAKDLRQLGGFDCVRVSADSELLERAETVFGKERIQHIPVASYVATYHDDSLTGGGKFSIGWRGIRGARGQYVANFRAWHARNRGKTDRLRVLETDLGGRFPTPKDMPRSRHGHNLIQDQYANSSFFNHITSNEIILHPQPHPRPSLSNQRVTVCMATFPGRFGVIGKAVQSLLDQSRPPDEILIHVNQTDDHPPLPKDRRIKVHASAHVNITDIGKFKLAADIHEGIILTVDDDIHYPSDYVERMVDAVNRYDGEAIVGVHGCVLPVGEAIKDWDEYRQKRRVHWFRRPVATDLPVNIVGTGTMAYDASRITFDWTKYQEQRMVDIHVAVEAQRKGIPMITPSRGREWMVPIDPDEGDSEESIWQMLQTSEDMQQDILRVLNSISNWTLNVAGSNRIGIQDLEFLETKT
mgnify:CR=1 FL=1